LGRYNVAEVLYLQATKYSSLTPNVEGMFLFMSLSTLYLDWGNSLFMAEDPTTATQLYEKVVSHDKIVPSGSPLYSTISLNQAADIAKQIISNLGDVSLLPKSINPT
jgi:hypothetical protein